MINFFEYIRRFLEKRKGAVIFFFTFVALLWGGWQFAVPRIIERKIQGLCQNCLNGEFSADHLHWLDGNLVIVNPVIATSIDPESEEKQYIAKRALISYQISLWTREIFLKIHLEEPQFNIGNELPSLFQSFSWLDNVPGFFNIQPRLIISDGSLTHISGRQCCFNLDIDFSDLPTGHFEVKVNGLSEDGHMKGHLIKDVHGSLGIKAEFHQMALAHDLVDFSGLQGSFVLKQGEAELSLEGSCSYDDKKAKVAIDGLAQFSGKEIVASELIIGLDRTVEMRFSSHRENDALHAGELALTNFEKEEFNIVKSLLSRQFKELDLFEIQAGNFDANLSAQLLGGALEQFTINSIILRDLQVNFPLWQLSAYFPKAYASAGMDLAAQDVASTFNAELYIDDCKIDFPHFKKPCEEINARFHVEKGRIKKSSLEGKFIGLDGKIEVDGSSPEELANLYLTGDSSELVKLLPDLIRQGICKSFSEDKLSIMSTIKRHPRGITIDGTVNITNESSETQYPIDVRFDLVKTSESFWQNWPPHLSAGAYWNYAALKVMKSFLPGFMNPMAALYADWMQQQLGWNGLIIEKGRFSAIDLPLNKFVEPFLFEHEQFKLNGVGDFDGSFDMDNASISYRSNTITVENDDLFFELPPPLGAGNYTGAHYAGEHFFDFKRKLDFGELSIDKGIYFDRINGLLFTDLEAKADLGNSKIHFNEVLTCCHQMQFEGAIDIDYTSPDPGFFDADVSLKKMEGKFSSLQGIFSHFPKLKTLSLLPLEGDVILAEAGGYMRFAFSPDNFRLQAKSEGILSDCSSTGLYPGISLDNMSLAFDYDHEAKTLCLDQIKGEVIIGSDEKERSSAAPLSESFFAHSPLTAYSLSGSSINFSDVGQCSADFDLRFEGVLGQLLRLKGTCHPMPNGDRSPLLFTFDNAHTHFGAAYPTTLELSIHEDDSLASFQLKLPFKLDKLIEQTQPLFSKERKADSIFAEPNSGRCVLDVSYDPTNSQFLYDLKGYNLILAGHHINTGSLKGKKKGSIWSIEQLQLDELSVAADIIKNEGDLTFNFLGISVGQSLLAGLEGNYSMNTKAFKGNVNLLEIDLPKLNTWPKCEEFVRKYKPTGQFKGTGKIDFEITDQWPGWKVNTSLNGDISSAGLLGIHFNNVLDVSCHWDSNATMELHHFASSFSDGSEGNVLGSLAIAKASYDFTNEEVALDKIDLNAAAESLPPLADLLQKSFPEKVSGDTANIIRNCKGYGNLNAELGLTYSPSRHHFEMALQNGKYWFNGTEHDIANFVMTHTNEAAHYCMLYRYPYYPFWLSCTCQGPTMDKGQILISDRLAAVQQQEYSPELLSIDWNDDPHLGFIVEQVQGQFCGLGINWQKAPLMPESKNKISLFGNMTVNVPVAAQLVSKEVQEGLASWNIGQGYSLQGHWLFKKDDSCEFTSPFVFNGMLLGNAIEFKGYEFESLQSELEWSMEKIHFSNLWVQDPSGAFQMERLSMVDTKQGGLWGVSMKDFSINSFRPSLLKHVGEPVPRSSSHFVIPKLELGELTGIMGFAHSFKGNGVFHFTNHTKRIIHHPLFVIPAEILNRIGLDMSVLHPVTGSIYFDIRDGKVHLTKFKDVYSEGKLSKFYLPANFESTADFEGNLNLKVRMKQYNLLFKLAELFTVNVTGNLEKPIYSLKKQTKTGKKPRGGRGNGGI